MDAVAEMPARPSALGAEFELKTIDDVDAALHEMGWCRLLDSQVDAAMKARIEALKTSLEGQRDLQIGEQQTTLSERAVALEAALIKWGGKQLKKHLPPDSKTLKLPHGEMSFKLQPLAVSLGEGVTEKAVVASIDKKTKLLQLAANLLKKIALGAFHLDQLVRVTPSLDKDGIKTAWAENPKSRGTLKGLGIIVTGGEDAVCVAPSKLTVAKPA